MYTNNNYLKEMFIDEAKPALERHSGSAGIKSLQEIIDSKTEGLYCFFMGSSRESLDDLIDLLDTSRIKNMRYAFNRCQKLIHIPESMKTDSATDMGYVCSTCLSLVSIPAWNVSNVTTFEKAFNNCVSLKTIQMYGMKVSFDISASTKFEASDLVTIFNNLATVTTEQTLTIGATNLAKLSEEQIAIATNKGWTVV